MPTQPGSRPGLARLHFLASSNIGPAQVPAKCRVLPSGRLRGGQLGHHGAYGPWLAVEQVDEVVVIVPEVCRHCGRRFPDTSARTQDRGWRQQVGELLLVTVRLTEYQPVV